MNRRAVQDIDPTKYIVYLFCSVSPFPILVLLIRNMSIK
jgi:hypothetical protein